MIHLYLRCIRKKIALWYLFKLYELDYKCGLELLNSPKYFAVYKGFNATDLNNFGEYMALSRSASYPDSDTYYTPSYDPIQPERSPFVEPGYFVTSFV